MDSERNSNEKNDSDSLLNDSDVPKPFWVRHSGLQNDRIIEGLLDYNVHSIWVGVFVIFVILFAF